MFFELHTRTAFSFLASGSMPEALVTRAAELEMPGVALLDRDTLLYQFEIDNPTAFTQPWKGELTMARATGNIYEFACHEGNYALSNMLRGFRAAEKKQQ